MSANHLRIKTKYIRTTISRLEGAKLSHRLAIEFTAVLILLASSIWPALATKGQGTEVLKEFENRVRELHRQSGLVGKLEERIFDLAIRGYYNLKGRALLPADGTLTIIDYTKPSTEERLYVIDLGMPRLAFQSLVSHGRNTGNNYAKRFSNKPGSLTSSIGFFVTGRTYIGQHGYALKLKGVELKFNDNAGKRYIVIHGANYVSQAFIKKYGRLGRSWGCPVLPVPFARPIIEAIKDGSCLFIYFDDADYMRNSEYLDKKSAAEQWHTENENRSKF